MARRKLPYEHIRKIQKTSRSYYVTLPVQLIREFGWEVGDELMVEKLKKPKSARPALLITPLMQKKSAR